VLISETFLAVAPVSSPRISPTSRLCRHRSLYLRLLRHVLPYDLLPSTTQGAAAAATSRKVYGAACAILQVLPHLQYVH
jgi:hypothetical protein